MTNLFIINIFGYHKIFLELSSKIVKKKQRKIAELHPICHELVLVYQYFRFDQIARLMYSLHQGNNAEGLSQLRNAHSIEYQSLFLPQLVHA